MWCNGPCGQWGEREHFSQTQWLKGERRARCEDCTGGRIDPYTRWECNQCHRSFETENNLNNHMITHRPRHQCGQCGRVFDGANDLRQHRQVHLERNVACPLCGEVRFRSVTNAVAHVESGSCEANLNPKL
jgi:rubredoxin